MSKEEPQTLEEFLSMTRGAGMHPNVEAKVRKDVETVGHSVMGVFPTDEHPAPPFCYTIGLNDKYGFEFFVMGIGLDFGGRILNDIVKTMETGWRPIFGKVYPPEGSENEWVAANVRFMLADPTKPELYTEYCVQAMLWWGTKVPIVQLVIPDAKGRFPEHPEFDHAYMDPRQVLLYTVPAIE